MNRLAITHEDALRRANHYASNTPRPEAFRQHYHIMPRVGWMNDPNGLVYFNGEYHVFFQHHPYSAAWGPMHWGHVKSTNLVDWEDVPIALAPSEEYDAGGCFSGSAVVQDDRLALIYTGHVVHDGTTTQVQCLATSEDGIHFEKSTANPILANNPLGNTADFRDPKVWSQDGTWYMVVGTKTDHGMALLYKSDTLTSWDYVGVVAESTDGREDMWECPDLFDLDGKHALLISPADANGHTNTLFMVGQFDQATGQLVPESTGMLDLGQDFYAAQTFLAPDGRRILLAWMNTWDHPMVTGPFGWAGSLTLPRELFLLPDGRVGSRPVRELESLRARHSHFAGTYTEGTHALTTGPCLEIVAQFNVAASTATEFGLKLRCGDDGAQETVISLRTEDGQLTVDRSKSGLPLENSVSSHAIEVKDGMLNLHLFVDVSSLEIFVNGGEMAITNRIYPDITSTGCFLYAIGGQLEVTRLDMWQLRSALHYNH